MNEQIPFFDITLHYLAPVGAVMILGLLGGNLARMIKLPRVTGYLLTGLVIGPSVLKLISYDIISSLSIINDIALGLIMFAIGGVFERHHIKTVGKKVLWLTVGQSVGAIILISAALYFAGLDLYTAILLATIGVETAPAATILVIRECEAKGEFTDTLITVVATSNIACILGFQLVYAFNSLGSSDNILLVVLNPFYELGGSLIIGLAVGFLISKWEQKVHDQAELLMIIIAGVMLVTGLAHTLGLQPLFATLIMGAVTTNLSLMHRLVYIELRQVEQPLYIAFFVLAGASLHLELIPVLGFAGVLYFLFRIIGKFIGIYVVGKRLKLSESIQRYLGLGTIVHAGVAIGLVDLINRDDPELGSIISPIILSTILIFETIGPPVIQYILIKAGDASQSET